MAGYNKEKSASLTDEILVTDICDGSSAWRHERYAGNEVRCCCHCDAWRPNVGGQDFGAVDEARGVDEESVEEDEPYELLAKTDHGRRPLLVHHNRHNGYFLPCNARRRPFDEASHHRRFDDDADENASKTGEKCLAMSATW